MLAFSALPMDCPDAALIAELVNGDGTSLDAAALEQHLHHCARCEEVVAAAVSTSWASSPGRSTATTDAGASTQAIGGAPPGAGVPTLKPAGGIIPAGTRLGRYRVRRWLGRGGMGEVYEGYDPELDRRVALKLLRTHGQRDQSAQKRLSREAKTLARLSSPNVVAALDVGTFADQLFLVMELVEGPTLSTWLAAESRTWRDILDTFLAAGEGIAAAHEVGVIHRDFKPQNVLIGADGKPRVSDFGLAREENPAGADATGEAGAGRDHAGGPEGDGAGHGGEPDHHLTVPNQTAARLTQTGTIIGTPRYMAPEQFLRRPLDARVDQFSFCVALHEALYGVHPFSGHPPAPGAAALRGLDHQRAAGSKSPPPDAESQETLRVAVLSGRLNRLPRGGKVPRSLAKVLYRGLARDPSKRFPSLRDLLTALRRTARARRRRIAIVAAVVMAAAAAGTAAFLNTRPAQAVALVATGQAADWSDARIIARVPATIHCLHRLNERSVRLVWGLSRRAEDIDVTTGTRKPSPLVPESYAHGCPSTSPDGRSVVFEGYDHKDRPHIFHSSEPTGANAEPIVSSAEPTFNSEPLWLSAGSAFVFDIDLFHPGLFSLETNKSAVVPDRNRNASSMVGFYKAVSGTGDRIAIFEGIPKTGWVHLYRGQGLDKEATLTISGDLGGGTPWRFGANPDVLLGTLRDASSTQALVRIDRGSRLSWVARVPGRDVRDVAAIDGKTVAIITLRRDWDIEFRDANGDRHMVPRQPSSTFRTPSATADGDILYIEEAPGVPWHVRRYRPSDGSFTDVSGDGAYAVESLPGGEWLVVSPDPGDSGMAVQRCRPGQGGAPQCRVLFLDSVHLGLFRDPSSKYVAYSSPAAGGQAIKIALIDGGTPVVVAASTSGCQPVWSSPTTLWFSRRTGASYQWLEFNIATNEPTGRTRPARGPCLDTKPDTDPPVTRDVRSVITEDWDVRVHELP